MLHKALTDFAVQCCIIYDSIMFHDCVPNEKKKKKKRESTFADSTQFFYIVTNAMNH